MPKKMDFAGMCRLCFKKQHNNLKSDLDTQLAEVSKKMQLVLAKHQW
jgi:hypothetical protein